MAAMQSSFGFAATLVAAGADALAAGVEPLATGVASPKGAFGAGSWLQPATAMAEKVSRAVTANAAWCTS